MWQARKIVGKVMDVFRTQCLCELSHGVAWVVITLSCFEGFELVRDVGELLACECWKTRESIAPAFSAMADSTGCTIK